MGASVARRPLSHPVPDGEHAGQDVRLHVPMRQAKASLEQAVDPAFPMGNAIWEVLVKGHGSVKAMAFTMGNRDRSLLRREVLSGELTLAQLLQADEKALAAFGEFLVEHFGAARKSKAELARERLPELLATLLDLTTETK